MIPEIKIEDYNYCLPDEKIAKYPLQQRDASKLLRYMDGKISEHTFKDMPELLPEGALLIYNDTRVVPARLHFQRPTGAHIEIFCLEPELPNEYNLIFSTVSSCRWKCIVGNVKRWKSDVLNLYNPGNDADVAAMGLHATLVERDGETSIVQFDWKDGSPFSRVLEVCGNIPIPPYLDRDTEDVDKERYQTLYARYRGSVAAPTAGLHFTQEVLDAIRAKGIDEDSVCLHVGAGTFLPVKSSNVAEHTMHREPFVVTRELIVKLLEGKTVVAVGTTSVRTLESLYYVGIKCIEDGRPSDVDQWMPYTRDYKCTLHESLSAILEYMDVNGFGSISVGTRIIIVPGFKFRIVNILITNFHQPQSTLLLLISAFVNGDWQKIYRHALDNGFRFLSYGDSSLLYRAE
ncbi:MAG: S-adenosylmethionine:tRNA ribosyltransferase-isomerase [Bacteroides sp.]|nr:S-adenosylmethionine:tRNA ribosyltransferase-isomerase [Bacteroides sp.]